MKTKTIEIVWVYQEMFIGLITGLSNESNHTKCVPLNSQKCMIESILIILYLINFTTIHLQFNEIEVLELVTLLMTDLIKYVFQIKQKIQIHMFLT